MSPFRKILVQVDTDKACNARVTYAAALAARYGASLTGVFSLGSPSAVVAFEAYTTVPLMEARMAAAEEAASQAKSVFEEAAQGADDRTMVSDEGPWERVMIKHAHAHDLVVAAQPDQHDDSGTAPRTLASDVVVAAGRPVVIVPYIGAPATKPKNILIGWKDSREAARAVRDGLPFMEGAKVHLMTVNEEAAPVGVGGDQIAEYLQAHGVDAVHHPTQADGIGVADLLVSRVSDLSADMIIVGGYSHNRWQEAVLGGVTRGLLGQMTVPVLMSH
jgi:nucleotide-binding universal stress UspA family protein